jgi:hypothetical protein
MYVFNNKEYLLSLKKKIVEVEVVEERWIKDSMKELICL